MNGWPTIVTEPVAPPRTSRSDAGGVLLNLARTLITISAVLLICVLVAVLLPENEDNVSQVLMSSALLSLAVGLLTIMLVVVLVPLLTIICIGIPIALIIVLAFVAATVVGWAALSLWSQREAYAETAESSFYVQAEFRGAGIGRLLKQRILAAGRDAGLHTILARVAAGNEASIHLNQSCGFQHIGIMKEVGYKFNRRIDVHLMQFIYPD